MSTFLPNIVSETANSRRKGSPRLRTSFSLSHFAVEALGVVARRTGMQELIVEGRFSIEELDFAS